MELQIESYQDAVAIMLTEDWKKKVLALVAAGAIATGVMVKNKSVGDSYVQFEKQETRLALALRTSDSDEMSRYQELKKSAEGFKTEAKYDEGTKQWKITFTGGVPEKVKEYQEYRTELMKKYDIK